MKIQQFHITENTNITEHKKAVNEQRNKENLLSSILFLLLIALFILAGFTSGWLKIIIDSVMVILLLSFGEYLISSLIRQIARFSHKPL